MGGRTLTNVLRWVLGSLGVVVLMGAIAAVAVGQVPGALPFAVAAAVLVIAAAYEHGRYRAAGEDGGGRPGAGFQRTEEVFNDPTTGRRVRVWYDRSSGRRDYRDEA